MRALRIGSLVAVQLWSVGPVAAQHSASPLGPARVELDSLTAGDAYLVYGYRLVNPVESRGGASAFSVDLRAPLGTGVLTLPATGRFVHGAGLPGVRVRSRVQDHVPVGPISPPNWKAFLHVSGRLDWYGGRGGLEGQFDSVAPGDSLSGFGLRSPFLPGVRVASARPTFASCCTTLRPPGQSSEPEYPNPSEFAVSGWTVGPTYAPSAMSAAVVAAQLGRACADLAWIRDRAVCSELRAHLDRAAAAIRTGDREGAHGALRAFLDALDTQHGSSKPVGDNAYWSSR
jgi:hypothetical protein